MLLGSRIKKDIREVGDLLSEIFYLLRGSGTSQAHEKAAPFKEKEQT
jgi:hypothetical protein